MMRRRSNRLTLKRKFVPVKKKVTIGKLGKDLVKIVRQDRKQVQQLLIPTIHRMEASYLKGLAAAPQVYLKKEI